jgi:SAM-dependent methyltransferase
MVKSLPSFDELKRPLPPLSPKNIYYSTLRAMLHTVGNLSDGIRTGNTYGYDSGLMLDYVYRNRASGRLGIGALLDRVYLDAVGWRGIRLRRVLVERFLTAALQSQLARTSPVRFLDVACGGGEYDLAVLEKLRDRPIAAELRDYKTENIERARAHAEERGLTTVRFRQADAFDSANYGTPWDVVVVSGLWEIIADDALVHGCLRDIARSLVPGGTLVFTIQPYHPQLEMIARTLTSNTGEPWIMNLRSLALFDQWLADSGLRRTREEMEENGIFGVVEAVKA